MSNTERTSNSQPKSTARTWVNLRPKGANLEEFQHHDRLVWRPKDAVELQVNVQRINQLLDMLVLFGKTELRRLEDCSPVSKVDIDPETDRTAHDSNRFQPSDSHYDGRNNSHVIAINYNHLIIQAEDIYKKTQDFQQAAHFLEKRVSQEIRNQLFALNRKEAGWMLSIEAKRALFSLLGAICVSFVLAMGSEFFRPITQAEMISTETLLRVGAVAYFTVGVAAEIARTPREMEYSDYVYEALEGLHVMFVLLLLEKMIAAAVLTFDRRMLVRRVQE